MKRLIVATTLITSLFIANANAASTVTVFAASSLTESFTELGKQFEKTHPGIKIIFSFQASSNLLTQIKAGAPADIFASAETFTGGTDYLINRVVVAVPKNSKLVKVSDLNEKIIWIQCAHEVPCGAAADSALIGEGVVSKPVSLEPKVSSAVAKLLAGEVDAAIIYRTDVLANSKKLKAIEFVNIKAAQTTYQIAQFTKNRWASTFFSYLRSKKSLKFMQSKGFEIK